MQLLGLQNALQVLQVVRLRCAVEEVAGDVLLDAHRLGAGHRLCSADSYAHTGSRVSSEQPGRPEIGRQHGGG
eukprot:4533714-Prymnesium_polylepis.1